jgi:hypothetical protein
VSVMPVATGAIAIPPIEIGAYIMRIVGDSPLIVHAWSAKAKKEMLDKQMGKARAKKEPKDPQRDYEDAFYRLPDGSPAFPTIAFKAAAVGAARQIDGLKMTFLRGAFHTIGELVEIEGTPRMREDMVKISMDTADIRYRPEFPEWAVNLRLNVNTRALTLEQLVHLFTQAGFSEGVGEWRPEKNGRFGMFHVESIQEVKE